MFLRVNWYGQIIRLLFLAIFLLSVSPNVHAQLILTNAADSAAIDFATMQSTVGNGPFIGGFVPSPAVSQLNSNAWSFTGLSDGNLLYGGSRTTGDYARGATTGLVTTGGIYSYRGAPASAANPTLMFQPAGGDFSPGTVTLRVLNSGTTVISQLRIYYNIFARNDQGVASSFNFSWSTDDVTYTDVPALNYTTTEVADGLGWQQVGSTPSRSTILNSISFPPTTYVYLRWTIADVSGTGSRDEIGLDDIAVKAVYNAPCSPPTGQASVTSFSAVSAYQMNVNFTRGNGTGGVLLVASTSPTLSSQPVSGVNYVANSNFGNGDPVGGGFVIFRAAANGAGNAASMTLTGLSPSTTYYIHAFEYNVTVPCYQTPGNSNSQTTAAGSATGPTDLFRSITDGNWNNTSTWQSSSDGGTTWIPATAKPTSSSSGISVRTGDTVTISAPETARLLTIQTGAAITYTNQINGGWDLDIADGAGDDLVIAGTLELFGLAPGLGVGAVARVQSGGIVKVNANNPPNSADDFAFSTSVFWNTGSVLDWNTTATFQTSGITYFPNAAATDLATFRISQTPAGFVGAGSATTFQGRLEVNAPITFSNAGVKIFRNGVSGTSTLTQNAGAGQFQITGSTNTVIAGNGVINLNTAGLSIVSSANVTLSNNKTVNSGPFTVDGAFTMQGFVISGTASFNTSSGSTLSLGHQDGISSIANTGNVQVTGARSFSSSCIYLYTRTGNQVTGNALPLSIVSPGELRINNTGGAGNNTTTLTNTGTTTFTLRLIGGLFSTGIGQVLNIASGGTLFGTGGNQSQVANEGFINFSGTGTVSPGTGLQLTNVRINNGVNMGGTNTLINRTLEIAPSGFVANDMSGNGTAPRYSSSPASTLLYSCNCNYGAGQEWYPNTFGTVAGVPHNVTLAAGTSLNFGANTFNREMRGDLTINSNSTFALSTASGGDLRIGGNWTRVGTSPAGVFTHNNRLVRFNGTTANQTITVIGGGSENFSIIEIDKAAGLSVVLSSSPGTNLFIAGGTGGNSLRLVNGNLDLNGRTATFSAYSSGQQNNIGIDGSVGNLNRSIISTVAGGIFNVSNSSGVNSVVAVNRLSGNASTLTVGTGAEMHISTVASSPSGMTFGPGFTTINGTLRLNNFAYVTGDAPFYGNNSFLVYNAGGIFNRNMEWCCTSGAGYPFNVTVQNSTELRLNTPSPNGDANRAIAGTLRIVNNAMVLLSTTANNTLTIGQDLQLEGNLTLPTAVGGDLYIGRNWNRTATGVFNHNERAVFFNSAQNSTITADNGQYFPYLYVSKNAVGNTVSLVDSIAIGREMSVITGTFDPANKDATILSNATIGTARFGQVGASGAVAYSGTGRFIVERYIPTGSGAGQHPKSWQFLAVPTNGGQTIRDAWQEGAATPFGNPKPGYGTVISGNMTNATSLGFDVASVQGGPGMKTYNPATNTWVGVPNTNSTPLHNQKGYMIFVRGDRSVVNFSGANSSPLPTNLRSRGRLFVPGSNPPPSTTIPAGGFESIGNPYASAINFRRLTRPAAPAVDSVFYVWDPLLPGSNGYGFGGFQTISASNNYRPSPGGTANYNNLVATTKINSGQAFIMSATGGGGTVSFTEAAKDTFTSTLTFRGGQSTFNGEDRHFFRVELAAGEYLIDAAVAAFDRSFGNEYDANDARKMSMGGEQIAIDCMGNWLSVEARRPVIRTDTVFYRLANLRRRSYQLRIGPENMPNGLTALLVDQFLKTTHPVSLGDSTYYDFTVNENPASSAPDRFYVIFRRGNGSPSGQLSQTNGQQPSQPIRLEGKSVVNFDAAETKISVYPNPVAEGKLNLRFEQAPAGRYQLRLFDLAGRMVYEKQLMIRSNAELYSLEIPGIAAGTYQLRLMSEGIAGPYILQLMFQ